MMVRMSISPFGFTADSPLNPSSFTLADPATVQYPNSQTFPTLPTGSYTVNEDGKDGFDVCRELRQQGKDTAILMLTARTQLTDRVVGLSDLMPDAVKFKYLSQPLTAKELEELVQIPR